MRHGDAFSKSNWGATAFSVQIHGANIRKIGGREVGGIWKLFTILLVDCLFC